MGLLVFFYVLLCTVTPVNFYNMTFISESISGVPVASLACCHFSTSTRGERHSRVCARTPSSCSQTVSALFPLGVVGMSDTFHPPERKKKNIKNCQPHHGYWTQTGPPDWACVSLISVEGDVKILCSFHSAVLHTGAPVSTFWANKLPPYEKHYMFPVAAAVSVSYLLFCFYGRDGRQQTVDAVPPLPHHLSASVAPHISVDVECHGAPRCNAHPHDQTLSCSPSTGRLTAEHFVSRRRPEIEFSGQRCHSAESGHCCRWFRCCCCDCNFAGQLKTIAFPRCHREMCGHCSPEPEAESKVPTHGVEDLMLR